LKKKKTWGLLALLSMKKISWLASYSDLSEEVFFSRIDNDHKSKSYLSS
jgi:hypothetical protein